MITINSTQVNLWEHNMFAVRAEIEIGFRADTNCFNLLAGANVSAADPRAGYTRRMVAAVHPNVASDVRKMELLFERFRANARP